MNSILSRDASVIIETITGDLTVPQERDFFNCSKTCRLASLINVLSLDKIDLSRAEGVNNGQYCLELALATRKVRQFKMQHLDL